MTENTLAIVICVMTLVGSHPLDETDPNPKPCITSDCITAANSLHKNMNFSVDPCEDFYEFACGQYVAETRIPDDKGRMSSFDAVGEEVYLQGRQLLEAEYSDGDFESYKLARDHYKACTDEDKLEELGLEPILKKLKGFGGWPVIEGDKWAQEDSFKWWDWVYKMNEAGFGINALITFSIGADDKNSSWNVIGFDQASLGLSREYLIKGFEDKDVQHYYQYMVDTAVLLGADNDLAKSELKESLLFEISLANINSPKEERRNASVLYNSMTLGQVPSFDGLPPSWTEYVQTLLTDADKANVDHNEKVVLTNVDYFEKLANLIQKTKRRTIANHLAWQATKSVMTYLNKDALNIKVAYDKALAGIKVSSPRWKRCVNVVGFNSLSGSFSLGLIAGSMYVRKYFNPQAKEAMLEMTSYIRKAFKEDILEKLDWMDANTKQRANEKLDQMDQFIAYQDEFINQDIVDGLHNGIRVTTSDYLENTLHIIKFWRVFYYNRLRVKIDPNSWLEHSDVSVVNAFYGGDANYIEFPAGILQGLFFNANIPKYMNFAAIGSIIGHEITHGFDDKGKQRNGKGEIENWWEQKTEDSFKEKAQCIIDQYANFTDHQVGLKLNGIQNQGENIADNGGLKEAYKAYLRWVSDNHEEPNIVGFPYSSKQMFWISFSQVWCFKYKDETLKSQILTGSHSPGRFRVTGSLQNNEDFAKDFDCPVGSKMNPVQKCAVW